MACLTVKRVQLNISSVTQGLLTIDCPIPARSVSWGLLCKYSLSKCVGPLLLQLTILLFSFNNTAQSLIYIGICR